MKIEIAGYEFNSEPTSRPGTLFMRKADGPDEGEGTEIDEYKIQLVLDKLFREVM